ISEYLNYEIKTVNLVFLWPAMAIYATAWLIALISDSGSPRQIFKTQFLSVVTVLFVLQALITLSNKILTDVYFISNSEAVFERGAVYFAYIGAILLSITAVV